MFKKATRPYAMAKVCTVSSNLNERLFYFKICLFTHLLYFSFLTLFVYGFSNVSFKPANVMSCHELNEQNEVGDDDVDDYKEENQDQSMLQGILAV